MDETKSLYAKIESYRSVDPFGHGLMMPYLMMLSDIKQMVIGRINSKIKNTLKHHHQLHFRWAQNWDPVKIINNIFFSVSEKKV